MEKPQKRPSIKDVAKLANVHFTTVSMALRGNPRIPEKTRKRISEIAESIGYRKDPVFMALTSRRRSTTVQPTMAFLTNRPTKESFQQTVHLRYFLEGAMDQANAMGYRCELILAGEDATDSKSMREFLETKNCQGIIIGAADPQHSPTVDIDWSQYATVKIDARFMEPAAHLVSNDQMQVVRLAHKKLKALGYNRIGLALGRQDEEATHGLFASGWYTEQAELPTEERIPALHFGYFDDTDVNSKKLGTWARKHKLDALISNWLNVKEMVEKAGFDSPSELAYACSSLPEEDPKMAGIVQNHRIVGQKAAETLALLIKTRQFGIPSRPSQTYVEGYWKDGNSAPLVS